MKRAIGVSPDVLTQSGAVSREAAEALAIAVRNFAGADVGLAETGIAGPTGGTPERPSGLFWITIAGATSVRSKRSIFEGDRVANQRACAAAAFQMLLDALADG